MAKSPRELVIDEVNKIRKEKESRKLETQYQEYVEKAAEATDDKDHDYYVGLAEDIYVKIHPSLPKLP
jgi:hypothetical protein